MEIIHYNTLERKNMISNKPKICIQTLGCKVNQQESQLLAEFFTSKGLEVVSGNKIADAYVINTCTVTSMADSKSRQKIRQAKKINPNAFVVAIGCYPQVSHDELIKIDDIDMLIGSEEKDSAGEIILNELVKKGIAHVLSANPDIDDEIDNSLENNAHKIAERTRAFIKIEDGCDRFCTYCIIPYARGKVRSRDNDSIIDEVKSLVKNGYKEIVITGINIALYGKDLKDGSNLYGLLKAVCAIDGEFRVRLGSLEPNVVDIEMAKRIASLPKLCPHWHLSLQSGSDKILNLMKRSYTSDDYLSMVNALRDIDPSFAITTDIIVGFPKETAADFEDSIKMVQEISFAKVHVFKYSRRKGTIACEIEGQIDEQIKTQRSKMLIGEATLSSEKFANRCEGQEREVLIIGKNKAQSHFRGITDNGIEVLVPVSEYQGAKENTFVSIMLSSKNMVLES